MRCRSTSGAVLSLVFIIGLFTGCMGDGDDQQETVTVQPTSVGRSSTAVSTPRSVQASETVEQDATEAAPTVPMVAPATPTPEVAQESPTPLDPTPTIPPVPTMPPPPPPATVSGSGITTSEPVQFPEGVAVVTVNHSGADRFKVRMRRTDGSYDRDLAEGTGIWKGSVVVVVNEAGEYQFDVNGQEVGQWQIDVLWPTPTTAPVSELPFHASGTGDQAIYFVLVQTGIHRLTMTHDGVKAFSVQLVTSEGRRYIDGLSSAGPATAAMEFSIRGKAFEFLLLNVRADANWTIDIE